MQYIDYSREDISLEEIQKIFGSDCEFTHKDGCKKGNRHLMCIAKAEKLYYSDNDYRVYRINIICPKCQEVFSYNVEKYSILGNDLIGWKES